MLSDFENYILENKLFSKEDKLLLAISGGQDSVFLFHLLLEGAYNFSVAHCNFKLRDKESDLDESFVRNLCLRHGIECFVKVFDTKKEAKIQKLGTQEIARKLRYDWFDELKKSDNFTFILTAHHLTDNTETMLINLLRSTGVAGLHGIQNKKADIIRPLLFTSRADISKYLSQNNIHFRHDQSNDSDDYLRNKLRHHVLPELEIIEPNLDQVFLNVSNHVSVYEGITENLLNNLWKQNVIETNGIFSIPDDCFKDIEKPNTLLYFWLKPFGFNAKSLEAFRHLKSIELGSKIFSNAWKLTRERNGFDLRKNSQKESFLKHINSFSMPIEEVNFTITFEQLSISNIDFKQKNTLFFDAKKCRIPLTIRTWQDADKMQPLGLKGHKKISDILTDKKVKTSVRKSQLVLLDAEENIIALLPSVCSEVHKIGHDTETALAICIKYH